MTKQIAMSTTSWEYKKEPLSDSELDEWLLFKDEVNEKEVNSPALKLSKCKAAEQILHSIEDLGKKEDDYWLETGLDFPLFEEIQSFTTFEEVKPEFEQKLKDFAIKLNQGQFSSSSNEVDSEIHKQPLVSNSFAPSYENSTTFIFSNDDIIYFNAEPLNHVAPLQSDCIKFFNCHENQIFSEEFDEKKSLDLDFISSADGTNTKKEMEMVDEIIRNTALELNQWESDTSASDTRSSSPSENFKGRKENEWEREEEISDPEWKPESLKLSRSIKNNRKKSKPYWRGGSQEDKKLRKKEQNKNAATRYRQKKKAEVSEILKEEDELKEKKAKLEEKVSDIQNEIKYLKGLMRDLFKAKGFIN